MKFSFDSQLFTSINYDNLTGDFRNPGLGIQLFAIYAVVFLISFGLQYWFFTIIKKAYIYIKDKRAATGGMVVVQQMGHVYVDGKHV